MREIKTIGNVKLSLLDASEWESIFPGYDDAHGDTLTIEQAYRRVGFFRRCVALRATALARVPFTIEQGAKVVYDSDLDEPPADEVAWATTLPDWLVEAVAGYVLAGGAYALILQQGGRIQGLQPWNPFTAKPEITRSGIYRVERTVDGRRFFVPSEDVLQVYNADPLTEIGPGSSDAGSALLSAEVLEALSGFTARHLRSGLVGGTAVVSKGIIPEDAWAKFKNWFNRYLKGKRGASGIVNIPNDGQIVTIGEGFKGLANVDLTTQERENIATALGIPHGMVMSNETGAKATSEQDAYNFTDTTVQGDGRVFQRALNAQIFEPRGFRLKFQWSRLPCYQAAQLEKAKAWKELEGIFTREEIRVKLGEDAVPKLGEFAPPPPQLMPPGPDAALVDAEKRLAERYPTLKLLAP